MYDDSHRGEQLTITIRATLSYFPLANIKALNTTTTFTTSSWLYLERMLRHACSFLVSGQIAALCVRTSSEVQCALGNKLIVGSC